MRAFLHGLDRNGERYLMLLFYCFIVFVIVTEVIRRFVLDFSSLWGEEAARISADGRNSTLLPAHPVRSVVSKVPGRSPGSPLERDLAVFPGAGALSD